MTYNLLPPDFENALCRQTDPDLFFPDSHRTAQIKQAKIICRACEHELPCAAFALRNRIEDGIWGGITPEDRRAYWRRYDK